MRLILSLNERGELCDPDGDVLGVLVALVLDRPETPPAGHKGRRGVGGVDQAGVDTSGFTATALQTPQRLPSSQIELEVGPAVTAPGEEAAGPTDSVKPEVREVWDHYVAATKSRRKLSAKEIRLIEAALKLRGLTAVKRAISGLAASPFHNGQNDRKRKYLAIRYAIGGNAQSGETAEERIDSMAAQAPDAALDERFRSRTGANEGRYNQLKRDVTSAWRPPDKPQATQSQLDARDAAITELREYGIHVRFDERGWPIFDELNDYEAIG